MPSWLNSAAAIQCFASFLYTIGDSVAQASNTGFNPDFVVIITILATFIMKLPIKHNVCYGVVHVHDFH